STATPSTWRASTDGSPTTLRRARRRRQQACCGTPSRRERLSESRNAYSRWSPRTRSSCARKATIRTSSRIPSPVSSTIHTILPPSLFLPPSSLTSAPDPFPPTPKDGADHGQENHDDLRHPPRGDQ